MAGRGINIKEYFEKNVIIRPIPYYPVGMILAFADDTDPNLIYGSTWEKIAKGRILVAYQSR